MCCVQVITAYPDLFYSGPTSVGKAPEPIRDLLDKWGLGKLASPTFVSALEMLGGNPNNRGGVRTVAKDLAKYDDSISRSSSSIPNAMIAAKDAAILNGWRRMISATIRQLTLHELGEFLHAYVFRKGTCPNHNHIPYHCSAADEIGDLARATVEVLLAARVDINHRHRESDRRDGPTALHQICLWLVGAMWDPSCRGFKHTRSRARFMRFLIERCGADVSASVETLGAFDAADR
ncbi:hypothetical protein N0V88_005522 [Collariella sp. IMI 366227]|nr:hypothetical protein N0V88_005522 [Collariella sp. IMI 366227]